MSEAGRTRRFDEFGLRTRPSGKTPQRAIWPIERSRIERIGQAVMDDRNGKGRPHKGVDIFARAGSFVLAARSGEILRIVDGRVSTQGGRRRAGLFIDLRVDTGAIDRYLHLGDASVEAGVWVPQGVVLGSVAEPFTSGLAEAMHLHFEVRLADYDRARGDYGAPVDPRTILPPWRA